MHRTISSFTSRIHRQTVTKIYNFVQVYLLFNNRVKLFAVLGGAGKAIIYNGPLASSKECN